MQYTVPPSCGGRPGIAMLPIVLWGVLALSGCEGQSSLSPSTIAEASPAPAPATAGERRADLPELGEPLGAFRFTMYYVAQESAYPKVDLSGIPDEVSGAPDDDGGATDGGKSVTLFAKDCRPIADVDAGFARQIDMQGTGKLRDGRVLNTSGTCKCQHSPCYFEIKAAWAMGANGRLSPFRSVAIDTSIVPLGSMLYIPDLDGLRMPGKAPWGGYIHDGCVMADDRGGGIKGHELDFFVAKKTFSDSLDRRHRIKRISVFDGKGWCERKDGRIRKAVSI